MRTALLVSTLGGGLSLLSLAVAFLATRTHPGPIPRADDDPPAHTAAGAEQDPPLIPPPPSIADEAMGELWKPAPDGPPVSLTASDGSGLAIAALSASAVVEGPLAFTEMRLAFDNPENRVREGTFKIVLPQGASLSRFALKINDAWQEGEVVPKERARVAYEDALHRKQDPALLERGAGNEFTARVFPIPAHGWKEVVVSYAQELVSAPYTLPLRGLPELGVLDVSVGGEGAASQRLHHEHFMPTADFVLESKKPSAEGRRLDALRAGNLVVARVRPVTEALPEPVKQAIVLVDTSASRALGLAAELRSVQALLQGLSARQGPDANVPVTVAAFDQEVVAVYHGDAKGFGQAEMNAIAQRRALGASNIQKALGWAKEEAKRTGATRVVLVTDDVPTAGADDGAKLAKAASALREGGAERLDVVAVGGLRDDALARKLVTAGLAHDGVVVAAADGAQAMVRRLEAGTRSDVAVSVEGASWSYPTRLDGVQPGDEVLVYAELDGEGAESAGSADPSSSKAGVPVRVKIGDGAGAVRTFDAIPVERPLVERAWAQAKIASLEAEERDHGKSLELERKIVALSTSHRVLSAYTALLVLETDADYARFRIDRRALADILTVSDGQLAWAKRGNRPPSRRDRAALSADAPSDGKAEEKRRSRGMAHTQAAPQPGEENALVDAPAAAAPSTPVGALESFGSGGVGAGGAGAGATVAPRRSEAQASRLALEAEDLAIVGAVQGGAGSGTRARGEEGSMGNPNLGVGAGALGRADVPAVDLSGAAEASGAPLAAPAPPPRQGASAPALAPAPAADRAGGSGFGRTEAMAKAERIDPFTGRFKQVKDRLARGDKGGALAIASSWQASNPGDVLALVSLGETSEATGDSTTAARAYGSIIDLFPSRADLRRFAGERLEHVKGKDAADLAIDTFDKARRDRPDHPASHRLAAFARLRRGEFAAAFDILVAGLAQHYPEGRFRGVDRILREDLGLVAAAWMKAEPARENDILERLRSAGGTMEDAPSIRFVLNWETDANDVDFHIQDAHGGHAYYASPRLPSGGDLYADVTTGYGPECFTVRLPKESRARPYTLQAHYFSRGPMGYGMGKLEIIDHDGKGGLKFEERPFIVMVDQAFVDLGTVE